MQIDIITLFPPMFSGFLQESIIKRAQAKGLVRINLHNLRDYTRDKHKKVDDRPFGGGPGMVLMPDPIIRAVEAVEKDIRRPIKRILLTPAGKPFTQPLARKLAARKHLLLLCGHYEGFDERIKELVDFEEISIGDYVLSGGELPALVIVDAVVRLIPGVLGNPASPAEESFESGDQLEFPQFTRPRVYRGLAVPPVLFSGHHAAIRKWRESMRKKRE